MKKLLVPLIATFISIQAFTQITPIDFVKTGPVILMCPIGKAGAKLSITHNSTTGSYFAVYADSNGFATRSVDVAKAIESNSYSFENTTLTVLGLATGKIVKVLLENQGKAKMILCKSIPRPETQKDQPTNVGPDIESGSPATENLVRKLKFSAVMEEINHPNDLIESLTYIEQGNNYLAKIRNGEKCSGRYYNVEPKENQIAFSASLIVQYESPCY